MPIDKVENLGILRSFLVWIDFIGLCTITDFIGHICCLGVGTLHVDLE